MPRIGVIDTPRFSAAFSEDVEWLSKRIIDGAGAVWAPMSYPATVLLLNPFKLDGTEMGWTRFAQSTGADTTSLYEGYPSPTKLLATAAGTGHRIEGPDEGLLNYEALEAVRETLGDQKDITAVAAFYLGWGSPPEVTAPLLTASTPFGIDYGLVRVRLGDFLTQWAAASRPGQGLKAQWASVVSFVWPVDRSWFLEVNPDACFGALSTTAETAMDVADHYRHECWRADPRGPQGAHQPMRR